MEKLRTIQDQKRLGYITEYEAALKYLKAFEGAKSTYSYSDEEWAVHQEFSKLFEKCGNIRF